MSTIFNLYDDNTYNKFDSNTMYKMLTEIQYYINLLLEKQTKSYATPNTLYPH